jgi:large subunit ribosomal protein L13
MTSYLTSEEARKSSSWWIVDAANIPVGRLATTVASVIRGKHKPNFTPNTDGGDFVVVINAERVALTGKKLQQKMYRKHTGYMGGLKEVPAQDLLKSAPEEIIESAVGGMLPEGVLGHRMKNKLKVYRGSEHPHAAQMPKDLKVAGVRRP